MNIVTVYPIIRGAFKDELTYWSAHSFAPGTIIEVPLRGRNIPALVGSITPASHAKANIKQASFMTRKIDRVSEKMVVRSECIRACEKIARYYAAPFGAVLKACIPDVVLASPDAASFTQKKTEDTADKNELDKEHAEPASLRSRELTAAVDVLVYQTNTADRISTYKSIVREEFARKKSMLIVAPTVVLTEELSAYLKKGIEERVIVMHGAETKKKQLANWKKILESPHPVLIISTPHFASIPRYDIGTIVVERESSRGYSSVRPPYIDYRAYMEEYAKALGTRLILSDTLLSIETLYRRDEGDLSDFFPLSYRVDKSSELIVIDMNAGNEKKGEKKNPVTAEPKKEKKEFKLMSEELHSMIEYAGKKSERMFVFAARRGLSPQTVCGDCGHTVECAVCKAPMVLHQSKSVKVGSAALAGINQSASSSGASSGGSPGASSGTRSNESLPDNAPVSKTNQADLGKYANDRFFLCHHCGAQRTALEGCVVCGSWKLVTLGIGLDTVAEEIKKQFPKRTLFKLDKDSVTTDRQARMAVEEFLRSKDGILLGTESALAFLPEVTYSAVVSLDSLFSIPDFRINERVCHIVLRLMEKTTGYLLIQTRNASNPVIKHIASGVLLNFYREELEMRKLVNYPPFSVHIKITVEDTRAAAAEKMKRLQDLLEKWEPLIFPAFVPTARGKSVLHMLISLPPQSWPDEQVRNILSSLPKEYAVRIHPESLL